LVTSVDVAPDESQRALPKRRRLHARAEFQKVYAEGQRYDGRLLAAFLRKNELTEQRLGVTASTKAIGKSVDRNRASACCANFFAAAPPTWGACSKPTTGFERENDLCWSQTRNIAFASFVGSSRK